jgi:hypothetical protein
VGSGPGHVKLPGLKGPAVFPAAALRARGARPSTFMVFSLTVLYPLAARGSYYLNTPLFFLVIVRVPFQYGLYILRLEQVDVIKV